MQVVSAVVLPILYLFTCVRIYDKLSQIVYGKALAVWDMFLWNPQEPLKVL